MFRNSFAFTCARIWNTLPEHMKELPSVSALKRKLRLSTLHRQHRCKYMYFFIIFLSVVTHGFQLNLIILPCLNKVFLPSFLPWVPCNLILHMLTLSWFLNNRILNLFYPQCKSKRIRRETFISFVCFPRLECSWCFTRTRSPVGLELAEELSNGRSTFWSVNCIKCSRQYIRQPKNSHCNEYQSPRVGCARCLEMGSEVSVSLNIFTHNLTNVQF